MFFLLKKSGCTVVTIVRLLFLATILLIFCISYRCTALINMVEREIETENRVRNGGGPVDKKRARPAGGGGGGGGSAAKRKK